MIAISFVWFVATKCWWFLCYKGTFYDVKVYEGVLGWFNHCIGNFYQSG
jgi:hypothetical protein